MSAFDFSGVITALVTPFKNGDVDYRSFQRLVQSQLADGIEGFVVNGTTGESPTLTIEEVRRLFEIAKGEAAGAVPVIVGTGLNSTARTIEATERAAVWGADAALVVTPYYNKPPQRGLMAHFSAVADASRIPIILYNVPGRTITAISAETTGALSRHPKIIGIKEASGDLKHSAEVRRLSDSEFFLTSGDDATCVDFALQGGVGVISVVSHLIATPLRKLIERARAKDQTAAHDYKQFQSLVSGVYVESNPIPVKAALYIMGVIDSPELRLPLVSLEKDALERLAKLLSEMGLVNG